MRRHPKPDVFRAGFFSLCDQETQRRLRDSRAKALVAENELKAFQAQSKLDAAQSVSPELRLVQELVKVTRLANNLKRNTVDAQVGGWAATVADSLTKSVADKAPSSLPSLESVGLGSSGLKSSDGEVVDHVRFAEYQSKRNRINAYYDGQAYDLPDEQEFQLNQLRDEYQDVSMTKVDRVKKSIAGAVMVELMQSGRMRNDDIDDIVSLIRKLPVD